MDIKETYDDYLKKSKELNDEFKENIKVVLPVGTIVDLEERLSIKVYGYDKDEIYVSFNNMEYLKYEITPLYETLMKFKIEISKDKLDESFCRNIILTTEFRQPSILDLL